MHVGKGYVAIFCHQGFYDRHFQRVTESPIAFISGIIPVLYIPKAMLTHTTPHLGVSDDVEHERLSHSPGRHVSGWFYCFWVP